MNSNAVIRDLRSKFSVNGWIVCIYYLIMNLSVSVAIFVDEIILWIRYYLNPDVFQSDLEQVIIERAAGNGWGYLLACVIGGAILLFWKKPEYCFREIWSCNKPMSAKAFIVLFCAFLSGQAVQILLTPVIEWLLNGIGLSAMTSLESATVGIHTVSMFLYVAIFAPIFEEVLFRGLILRNLLPYGKKFAIVCSAFLFGIFHGNLVQSPYAFIVGLVLGYAAVEYGLVWAVVLHVFNNFILGDIATRLAEIIPGFYVDIALYILIFGCAIATLILAAVNCRKIANYLSCRKMHPLCLKSFYSSWGVIAITVLMFGNMILLLFL